VEENVSVSVHDAHVHIACMKIDTAIVLVAIGVESHIGLLFFFAGKWVKRLRTSFVVYGGGGLFHEGG